MRLKLSVLLEGGREEDLSITADPSTSIGDIAEAITLADPKGSRTPPPHPLTLRIDATDHRVIPPTTPLTTAGLRSGQRVAVVVETGQHSYATGAAPQAATLTVVDGPDRGQQFPLRPGTNQVGRGRGNDVKLADPMVSKAHVRVNVRDQVDVADLGSANGMTVRGTQVARAVIGHDDIVVIGDTSFRVSLHDHRAAPTATVAFNRSPVIDPVFVGPVLDAPRPPAPPQPGRFPLIAMFAPVVLGCVLFLITMNPTSVLFVALSPLMIAGSFIENRVSGKKAFETQATKFRAELRDLEVQLHHALEQEGEGRRHEFPATVALLDAVTSRSPVLWSRHSDTRAFLHLRLGLGTQPSRVELKTPGDAETTAELRHELREVAARYSLVPNVPVVADFATCGSLGIAGPVDEVAGVARSTLAQLVSLHSPAEVVLCAVIAPDHAASWDWLKWLPHTTSDHSPIGVAQIAVSSTTKLVAALEELGQSRTSTRAESRALPVVVVLVDDDAPFERDHLVQVMEHACETDIHMIWMARTTASLPAACRTFVEFVPSSGSWVVGDVREAARVAPVEVDVVSAPDAAAMARDLAPVVDAGAIVQDDSAVPRRVGYLSLVGQELASSPAAIVDQWRSSNSLPSEYPPADRPQPKRKDNSLRAFVGATADEPFVLDLREHGPHALVGGTTGSGKSEFLQTWVLGMAAAHSPDRVNFLFIDYKGGAAFAECIHLPHCVGLVTDLSSYLVRRALASLKAELRYREELLHRNGGAKDLLELEGRDPAAAPPSLIIVVDEFATLVKEVPDFVDGVVDVAQRGRSLGLHLILATQRPAGVIRDNLRANTNLRVALRMADEDDSHDVVGSKSAAFFDPTLPGRGIAKMGPGRLTTFQSGYVGGWTTTEPAAPVILVDDLRLGGGERWEPPVVAVEAKDPGPNDLKRLVRTIAKAAASAGIPSPRKPWQPELATVYELAKIRPSRRDSHLIYAIRDDPAKQVQAPVGFVPDDDGNMVVYGGGGAGKSTVLRSLAVAAAISTDHPCHVYALDFGTRGLQMLEPLPNVGAVINGDDSERIDRLLRMLRDIVADRTERYAAADSAATITQYRAAVGERAEPRVVVLVDNFGALRQAMETSQRQAAFDTLQRLISDGRPLGVHFVMTADRPSVVPPAVMAAVQQRLTLRMAQDADYPTLSVPPGQLNPDSPPGRGSLEGSEVQVAVLGGVPSTGRQAAAIQRLATELRDVARWPAAPGVPRLPDEVTLSDLPVEVDGLPALGIADETLAPIGFDTSDPFLLIGPPQAHPEVALLGLVQSYGRWRPGASTVLLSLRRSSIATALPWTSTVNGADNIKEYLSALSSGDIDAPVLLAIDGLADLANSDVDFDAQALLRWLLQAGTFVVGLGDSFQVGTAYGSAKLLKSYRNGLALLPEQFEGDAIFSTAFPRVERSEFRPNCGYLVRQGRIQKVLVASPV